MPAKARPAATRGPRGRGSISERSDGIFVGEISRTENGVRRKFRVYGRNVEECDFKLGALKRKLLRGEVPSAQSTETVVGLLETWLERAIAPRRKETTTADHRITIDTHLKPRLGDLRLDRLTPDRIEGIYEMMERAGVGPRARQKAHVVLGAALRYAERRDLIAKNPILKVNAPTYHRQPLQPWSAAEAKRFLKAIAGDELEPLYLLALYTGMRQGELLGLQRTDIDLKAGAVYVQHSLQNIAGTRKLVTAKTDGSRRRIDLPKSVVASLRAHLKRLGAERNASTYAFPDATGQGRLKSNFMRRSFRPLLAKAKLRQIRFHDLRHTMASLMLAGGVNPKIVQERLGHTRITTTLDIYSHAIPTLGQNAVNALERTLLGRRSPEKLAPRRQKKSAPAGRKR